MTAQAESPIAERRYDFRLYVTGTSPRAIEATHRIKLFCEENLPGRYDLAVIDIYQQPELARKDQIVALPTLIRAAPEPVRMFIGDLTTLDRLLVGAELDDYHTRLDRP
jgi:circadian clock protein KaiB